MKSMIALMCLAATFGLLAGQTADDPAAWTESKWGPDDEIGAANLLTPDRVKLAANLVTTGKTYALGIETNAQTPAYGTRFFHLTIAQPGQIDSKGLGPTHTTYNDDMVSGWLGIGSQIDGLGHIGINHVYYNGFRGAEFAQADGLSKLGIEKVPPIVARGVLLNMARFYQTDVVPAGTAFNSAEITQAAEQQGIEIREGDVVLFHTGWLSLAGVDNPRYLSGEPGLGVDGARFLAAKNIVAVGADTWGVEVLPFEAGTGVFQVHQEILTRNGIYNLENMNTAELAADGVDEFMFVLGVAKITGAVQMIINPVAIR